MNSTFVAGDSLAFTVSLADYPATDGWTLKCRLTPRFTTPSQSPITLTATTNANGVDYDVAETPANTAGWKAGKYGVSRWVEKSGARKSLGECGELEVKADPTTLVAGADSRSQAAKAVEDLKAALATFNATGGRVKSYSIGTRQMEFESGAEILKMLNFWQGELANEEARCRLNAGGASATRLQVRF